MKPTNMDPADREQAGTRQSGGGASGSAAAGTGAAGGGASSHDGALGSQASASGVAMEASGTTPPAWAEHLLRLSVGARDFDSVSGDLLEEYRDTMVPARGRGRADRWYVGQVLGFVWRGAGVWALLFAGAFIARMALDWLVPVNNYATRAAASTYLGIGILLLASFGAARRTGSFAAGPFFGLAVVLIAAPIKIVSTAAMLAVWHEPSTLAAIGGSGGLEEEITLPLMMVVPGLVLGIVGGFLGAAVRRIRSA